MSSVFVTRKELIQRAKPLLGTARHFCCKHRLLIHVEHWTFSHFKESSLRDHLNQASFKVIFFSLFFSSLLFSFLDFWHHIFGIFIVGKCWPWSPKTFPAIIWIKDCSVFFCEQIASAPKEWTRKEQARHRSVIQKKHIKRLKDVLPHYMYVRKLFLRFLDSLRYKKPSEFT